MSKWNQLGLLDPKTESVASLTLYHDLVLVIIVSVLVLVGWFLSIFLGQRMFFKGMGDLTIKEDHNLEVAWTVAPSVFLAGLGLISLHNLYMMEVGSDVVRSVEATGHQWYWDYHYAVDMGEISGGFTKEAECVAELFLGKGCEGGSEADAFSSKIVSEGTGTVASEELSSALSFTMLRLGVSGYWSMKAESYGVQESSLKQSAGFEGGFRLQDVTSPCFLSLGVKNEVKVSTADVMHSWGVPELGVKADAVPGRLNCIKIVPWVPGFAYGNCYELCGPGHSTMPITCMISSPENVEGLLVSGVYDSGDVWSRVKSLN